ncbi:hypothetical protein [Microbacterium sp. XT11]|uniref:hypothetical protein n=1 Tax=Microbacterium sp. XT11 TaxID=367477 RepID=UPI000835EC20|nr:hypothetical protein [Microbacterium sp. XT11]
MSNTLAQLLERAVAGVRGYLEHEGPERAPYAKAAAAALVEARSHFFSADGTPDYLGRSREYREFVAQTFAEAEVPEAYRAKLGSVLRYHVSPILRERFGEEVEALGLEPGSLQDRKKRRRDRDARIIAIFAGGPYITELSDLRLIASLARLAFTRIAGMPEGTPETTAARVRDEYAKLAETLDEARKRLDSDEVTE